MRILVYGGMRWFQKSVGFARLFVRRFCGAALVEKIVVQWAKIMEAVGVFSAFGKIEGFADLSSMGCEFPAKLLKILAGIGCNI